VVFPEAIRDPKLAGLEAEFDIEVLEVKKRALPELDDEFANSIREGLTAEQLKKEVRGPNKSTTKLS
jgi:trigger factor